MWSVQEKTYTMAIPCKQMLLKCWQEYKAIIRPENYVINNGVIESISDHVKLPCHANAMSCVTTEATYIWTIPDRKYSLQLIRGFRPTRLMDASGCLERAINQHNRIHKDYGM